MWSKPSPKLKRLWTIVWAIWATIAIIGSLVCMLVVDMLIFGICLGICLAVFLGIVLWIPAAYRAAEYNIGDSGVTMSWGVIWKKEVTVPYAKITNVDITRGPLERALDIGTIHLQTAGAGGQQGQKAELKLPGIEQLQSVKKTVTDKIGPLADTGVKDKDPDTILSHILNRVESIASILKKNYKSKQD